MSLLDRPLRTLIENPAGLGRNQAPRRTHEQANSQPLFELDNSLGNRRLTDVLVARHRRKRAGIDDAYKHLQCRESVHSGLQSNEPQALVRLFLPKWKPGTASNVPRLSIPSHREKAQDGIWVIPEDP